MDTVGFAVQSPLVGLQRVFLCGMTHCGEMAKAADETCIQFRLLNRKGTRSPVSKSPGRQKTISAENEACSGAPAKHLLNRVKSLK